MSGWIRVDEIHAVASGSQFRVLLSSSSPPEHLRGRQIHAIPKTCGDSLVTRSILE
jgi:hypothetical protein